MSGNPPKKRRNLNPDKQLKSEYSHYSVIEYGSFGDGEVETAINNHPQNIYRIYQLKSDKNIMEYGLRTDRRFRNQVFSLELMIITLFMRVILMMSKEIHLTIN